MKRIRPTAVSGMFYPRQPEACRREVEEFIAFKRNQGTGEAEETEMLRGNGGNG